MAACRVARPANTVAIFMLSGQWNMRSSTRPRDGKMDSSTRPGRFRRISERSAAASRTGAPTARTTRLFGIPDTCAKGTQGSNRQPSTSRCCPSSTTLTTICHAGTSWESTASPITTRRRPTAPSDARRAADTLIQDAAGGPGTPVPAGLKADAVTTDGIRLDGGRPGSICCQ